MPDPLDGKVLLEAVAEQRNGALNDLATAMAMLKARDARIAALEAELKLKGGKRR